MNLGQERLQGMGVGRNGARCDLCLPHTMSQNLARQQWNLSRHHTVCSRRLLLPFPEMNRSLLPPGND